MRSFVKVSCLLLAFLFSWNLYAQERFSFAWLADLHIADGSASIHDLQDCIDDINANDSLRFVVLAGDITEFGSDREIRMAHTLLKGLNKPWYIVGGNHDSKWSESGCNTFAKTFGYEHFNFEVEGVRFIGTNSGPNMRMAPALLPRESMVWLDSIANAIPKEQPVVFINHYPMDTSMLNCFQVLDVLKKANTQLVLGGHWHNNVKLDYQGLPGILGRSTQATGKKGSGYNIVTIENGQLYARERIARLTRKDASGRRILEGERETETLDSWFNLTFTEAKPFVERAPETKPYEDKVKRFIPEYNDNHLYTNVQEIWTVQDNSDIGAGAITNGEVVLYTNTQGWVRCLNLSDGSLRWEVQTEGKVFSTPALFKNRVVVGSTDGRVYCYDLKSGKENWRFTCDKSVLATPVIHDNRVYIGASDGAFRALDLKTGKLQWTYPDIKGFIEAKAWVDEEQVVIGDWANTLYSFEPKTGKLQWTWKNKGSRMVSPAAVWPVKANGRIFFVTPERKTYAIDAKNGNTLWSSRGGRESIGLSPDQQQIYVKVMKDSVYAYSTTSLSPQRIWGENYHFGYEIAPTPITSDGNLIFIPTDKGEIIAAQALDGKEMWRYRLSFALVNYILPLPEQQLLITTMDGKISLMRY